MMGHKICFSGEIRLIIPKLSLLPLFICSTGLIRLLSIKTDHFELFVKIGLVCNFPMKKHGIIVLFVVYNILSR